MEDGEGEEEMRGRRRDVRVMKRKVKFYIVIKSNIWLEKSAEKQ